MTNFFKIPCLAACLLAFTFLIRCSGKNEHIKNSITGNIAGAADQKIVLEEATPKCIITIDDVVVDAAGNFSFDVQPDETGFYLLRFENGGTIKLVMHPKDRISIDSDTASIPHFL